VCTVQTIDGGLARRRLLAITTYAVKVSDDFSLLSNTIVIFLLLLLLLLLLR
jgi:hypothetical protein